MKHFLLSCLLLLIMWQVGLTQDTLIQYEENVPVKSDELMVDARISHWELSGSSDERSLIIRSEGANGEAEFLLDGERTTLHFISGEADPGVTMSRKGALLSVQHDDNGRLSPLRIYHVSLKNDRTVRIRKIPLWMSILPPMIAIFLALIFKEVIISLFTGIWFGAFIAGGLRIEGPFHLLFSFFDVIQKYMVQALTDTGHLSVIIFSLMIGGMVALISKNGGMAGVVNSLSRYANSRVNSQRITWLLGIAIFFDDYANTLVVGNTMRAVTDKLKVSMPIP